MHRTERLVLLRPLGLQDADWITKGIADPEVIRWLIQPPWPYARGDAEHFLRLNAGSPEFCTIVLDRPVGVVSLRPGPQSVLGFWLDRSAWGQGVMTQAVHTMLERHFAAGAQSVRSSWILGNVASERVHRKLGFEIADQTQAFSNFYGKDVTLQGATLTADRFHAQSDKGS